MKGPKAEVMFRAPKRCGAGAFLQCQRKVISVISYMKQTPAYDCSTELMKVRIGMNATLVRAPASAKRKVVAAVRGEE